MPNNPLSGYFRQPAIYIQLPSQGSFWLPGSLEASEAGEYPVYPMTAVDEIAYRTPDALFNGDAVVRVIQSCIPAIKNAWSIPASDLNTILTGIRIASYGHDMDIDTKCPNCGEESTFTLDLRKVVESIRSPDYTTSLSVGDLQIYFRPLLYKDLNQNGITQFEEQKLISVLESADIPDDEKVKLVADAFRKVSSLGIEAIQKSISHIKTNDADVVDPNHIAEFLTNCDKKIYESIKEYIINLNEPLNLRPLHIQCDKCSHQWDQPFTLDMSNFFE